MNRIASFLLMLVVSSYALGMEETGLTNKDQSAMQNGLSFLEKMEYGEEAVRIRFADKIVLTVPEALLEEETDLLSSESSFNALIIDVPVVTSRFWKDTIQPLLELDFSMRGKKLGSSVLKSFVMNQIKHYTDVNQIVDWYISIINGLDYLGGLPYLLEPIIQFFIAYLATVDKDTFEKVDKKLQGLDPEILKKITQDEKYQEAIKNREIFEEMWNKGLFYIRFADGSVLKVSEKLLASSETIFFSLAKELSRIKIENPILDMSVVTSTFWKDTIQPLLESDLSMREKRDEGLEQEEIKLFVMDQIKRYTDVNQIVDWYISIINSLDYLGLPDLLEPIIQFFIAYLATVDKNTFEKVDKKLQGLDPKILKKIKFHLAILQGQVVDYYD
jgi:hypothetical protein